MDTIKRLLLIVLWALFLFVCTCTHDLRALVFHLHVQFDFVSHPHFRELLWTRDIRPWQPFWDLSKLGHFTGFFIFEYLVYNLLKNHNRAIAWAIFYAVCTEILQLYFGRDGRIVDMFIDSCGILLSANLQTRSKARQF